MPNPTQIEQVQQLHEHASKLNELRQVFIEDYKFFSEGSAYDKQLMALVRRCRKSADAIKITNY